MVVRDALVDDAPAACVVLRRSIQELCTADHRNDPVVPSRRQSNKTPEQFISWVHQERHSVMVAVENGAVLAVGSVTDSGRIGLNYVSPDARFRGVSREMLRALETRACERGNARCTLESTATARRFYEANG